MDDCQWNCQFSTTSCNLSHFSQYICIFGKQQEPFTICYDIHIKHSILQMEDVYSR